MTTIWTDKTKVSGTSWNPSSTPAYLPFDSSQVYDTTKAVYDGAINTWSDISKPTTGWTDIQKAT